MANDERALRELLGWIVLDALVTYTSWVVFDSRWVVVDALVTYTSWLLFNAC
jgi:hypothetical protein